MFALLVAASVAISAGPPPKATPEQAAKAKEAFNAGKKLFDQGDYAKAVLKFEEAYAARAHPIIFFNIGKCYELIGETGKGETGRALHAYREYLRGIPDASDKSVVQDSIGNLERRLKERGVMQVTVFAEPGNAKLEVDGKDIGASPASTELTPGDHKLVAKAEGFQPLERTFQITGIRSQEVTVSLIPGAGDLKSPSNATINQPPPDAPVTGSSNPALTRKPPPPAPRKRLFTWVAAGVAVAAGGAGAGLGVVSMGATNNLMRADPNRTRLEADNYVSQANSMALGANVAYGVAGAAAITAVILFFVEGRN